MPAWKGIVVELVSGDQGKWIGAAICLLVGAAMSGRRRTNPVPTSPRPSKSQ